MSAESVPVGPARVKTQAEEAGFEVTVRQGKKDDVDPSEAWNVTGKKGARGFAGLWTKPAGAGTKAVGLWVWGPGESVKPIKLADFRTWLAA